MKELLLSDISLKQLLSLKEEQIWKWYMHISKDFYAEKFINVDRFSDRSNVFHFFHFFFEW